MSKLTSTIIPNLALAMVLWLAPAAAQQQEPSSELDVAGERPWARGVPIEHQETALKLFLEGNKLIKQSAFVQAAEKYNAALKHWDHPGIHYNLALALTPLRQPLEVHRHLEAAMSHGPEALDTQKYEFARTHKDLVRQQLAWVELTCDKPGAKVTMDGKLLFVAPGRYEGLAMPGQHSIVATLEGYEPTERSRLLQAGEGASIDLKLYTNAELTRYNRRWLEWIPWTVIGAGVAITAGGGLLHLQARDDFNTFDVQATDCYQQAQQADPPGPCMMNDRLTGLLNLGNTRQKVAVSFYTVGGAAVVTGMVMLYFNNSQSYRITPEQLDQERQSKAGGGLERRVSVVPLLGGGRWRNGSFPLLRCDMRRELILRNGYGRVLPLVLVLLSLLACIKPKAKVCSSGQICPDGLRCAANQNVCISTDCGDGIIQSGEVCDDGNIQAGDGCSSDCKSNESCGNGKVDLGEVCDDGNTTSGDSCSADCRSGEGCGNGQLDKQKGELCDDGNQDNEDNCIDLCQPNTCGDGYIDRQLPRVEQCDEGGETASCNLNCTEHRCGDGVVNAAAREECDDANFSNEDNCLSTCRLARCGDGFKQGAEQCDPGPAGESDTCNYNCTARRCGDHIVNASAGEQCDEGGVNTAHCDSDCTLALCGDLRVNEAAREECDHGQETTSCNYNCTKTRCGDRVVNVSAREQCDEGGVDAVACDSDCTLNVCGDGYTNKNADLSEQCDDGNASACGTCSSDCLGIQELASAKGSIVAVAGNRIADGWIFVINDGSGEAVFEFDKNDRSPRNGWIRVAINNKMSADAVADAILSAINERNERNGFKVHASIGDQSASTVVLENTDPGVQGNHNIFYTVNVLEFDVTGMAGGAGRDCPERTGCKTNDDCRPGLVCNMTTRLCSRP